MADDDALTDRNKVSTLLAVDTTGQRRRVLVDATGRLLLGSSISVGTVKVEDATDPTHLLVVDANGRIGVNISTSPILVSDPRSRIAKLIKFEPEVGEEIRRDETTTADYHGAAVSGSSTSDPVWDIIRFEKTALGAITRVVLREDIRWDQRTVGW